MLTPQTPKPMRRRPGRPPAQNRTDGQLPLRPFTALELEVLQLLAKGCTAKETARLMNRSVHTINDAQRSIYAKLDCSRAIEAVVWAVRAGLA